MTTDLNGATDRGADNTWPSTPGEFAARWNARTEEERAEMLTFAINGQQVALDLAMHGIGTPGDFAGTSSMPLRIARVMQNLRGVEWPLRRDGSVDTPQMVRLILEADHA